MSGNPVGIMTRQTQVYPGNRVKFLFKKVKTEFRTLDNTLKSIYNPPLYQSAYLVDDQ
jgi:hypothetical protein